jgi:glycosyltransferase involved in cell wall biosynthesis
MWRGKTVAVIFPTYNEKDSIRAATLEYFSTGLVDEVIVVNNNAAEGTSEEVAGTGAREIFEHRQGYGHALMCGIDHCAADLIILSEPDSTFSGRDLLKLLAYSEDVPVVFGTRTSREFIWAGANMGRFLRWGNWAVAKLIEVLLNTSHLSDVGCTYRLLRRDTARRVASGMSVGGSHAGAEVMLLTIRSGARFVEVPVNYLPRVGRSSVTGNRLKAISVGLQMIGLVLRAAGSSPRTRQRPPAFVSPRTTNGEVPREQLSL